MAPSFLSCKHSSLPARDLLEGMAAYEREKFANITAAAPKLAPLGSAATTDLLKDEIERLRQENVSLHQRLSDSANRAPTAEALEEAAMEKRISESRPVQNLKRMLEAKNRLITALKARLEQVDPTFDFASLPS